MQRLLLKQVLLGLLSVNWNSLFRFLQITINYHSPRAEIYAFILGPLQCSLIAVTLQGWYHSFNNLVSLFTNYSPFKTVFCGLNFSAMSSIDIKKRKFAKFLLIWAQQIWSKTPFLTRCKRLAKAASPFELFETRVGTLLPIAIIAVQLQVFWYMFCSHALLKTKLT